MLERIVQGSVSVSVSYSYDHASFLIHASQEVLTLDVIEQTDFAYVSDSSDEVVDAPIPMCEHYWRRTSSYANDSYTFEVTPPTNEIQSAYFQEEPTSFHIPELISTTGLGSGLSLPQYMSSTGHHDYNVVRNNQFYAHVPEWQKVRLMPVEEMMGAYGLHFPGTGETWLRNTFDFLQRTEVLAHEIGHRERPTSSEKEVRDYVRDTIGTQFTLFHYWL